jgi:hypothetical protein
MKIQVPVTLVRVAMVALVLCSSAVGQPTCTRVQVAGRLGT